ncbi:hypothetical protein [Sphingomonas glacialis]|nr:hypothetical protein [Sphingomonas glacialis]
MSTTGRFMPVQKGTLSQQPGRQKATLFAIFEGVLRPLSGPRWFECLGCPSRPDDDNHPDEPQDRKLQQAFPYRYKPSIFVTCIKLMLRECHTRTAEAAAV